MPLYELLGAAAIITDQPDSVERGVKKISEYGAHAIDSIGLFVTDHPNEFINTLSTFFIAVFTVVLAIKTAGLFRETAGLRTAADQQRTDMQASIVAAQTSANAAQKAADVAETALVVADRPYLVPSEPKLVIYRYGAPGMPPSEPPTYAVVVKYGFHNLGRGLAFLKEATVELIFEKELGKAPAYSDEGVRTLVGHFPIKSEGRYDSPNYGARSHLNAGQYNSIAKDSLRGFFYGYVKYTDIFGYLHTDAFCFRFLKIGDGANKESTCAIVAGNSFNYSRSEKIPAGGLEALKHQGAELSLERLAVRNNNLDRADSAERA